MNVETHVVESKQQYLSEAYDVFRGARFLGSIIWNGNGWSVVLRGSYDRRAETFAARLDAIEFVKDADEVAR
jgi:hypothetical protein